MEMSQAQTPKSLLGRVLDWLAHFERAMDMRPADSLELRVAELERRIETQQAPRPAKEG